MGEKGQERERREVKEDRKEKIKKGERRRKVEEMRLLSLGCRARNKTMICTRTAWPFVHHTGLGLATLQGLSEGLCCHSSRSMCLLP